MADCKEIQKMMVDFNKRALSIEQEELFVDHIEQCTDCREELEIYYLIEYGLDDEAQMPASEVEELGYVERFDFKGLVDLKLNQSFRRIDSNRLYNSSMSAFVFLADIVLILTIICWIMTLI